MFAILKNFCQYCIVIHCSLMFSVIFVSNFCSMVKRFLHITGLHWAALGFLAVTPLFCVFRWSRGMDVRCSSIFTASFLVGVSMDYGGVVSYLRIMWESTSRLHFSVRATLVCNDTIYSALSWPYHLAGLYLKMISIYLLVRLAVSTHLLRNTATSHRPCCRMIDRASLLDIVANKRNSVVAFLESKLPQIKV